IANQSGTGNIVAARAEGTGNGNQARCYNCRGLGHIARNYTARPKRKDAAYLQTQLLIAQKEEARIQLQVEEFDFMAAVGDLDEIEEVNANCILMANLHHVSTSGTQLDKAPFYDTDGSAEVQLNDNCYDNEIFYMFTQEEQCTVLLEPISKPQLVPPNDNHVTSVALSMVQSRGTVETSSAPNKETRAHQKTIYRNLVDQVAQVNMVNCNMRATNAELKSKLARYKIQEQRIEISQEKYDIHLSDDTTPSVARKFLNEVKNSLVTLQSVVKQKMTLEVHNWSSSAHKEVYKIMSHEIAPIINQVDARVHNFEIQFLQEAAKFIRDFKSLVKETDESLDKQKSLELEIKRLLKSSVSHDVMSVVQNGFFDVPSDLQTELDRTKEKLELCIIKRKKNTLFFGIIGTSVTPHVDKPKLIDVTPHSKKLHASIPSHSVPQPREFNVMKHCNVIAPKMFKINLPQTSRVDMVPHKQSSAIIRTNPITNFQRHVTVKENVSSDTVNAYSTGNIKLLINFVWKFLGTVRFGNDHIAAILGYGDLRWGNITITMVYFVEGLGHNLFSIGQFCDTDLEVAFRRNTCFIRDLDGVDLLKGNHSINLYTINLYDMASASPICLMARATPTKSWLWNQRLSHLNFDTINDLAKNDLVSGLPKFKYAKEHLCPSCEKGKSKRASHPPKPIPNSKQPLHLLHIDLCGPITKDETAEVIQNFLKKICVRLQAPVIIVHTDNETEFKNYAFKEYFDSIDITHETSVAKTPQQNRVVKRRNRTLVEAARTMLIFSHAPLFLWAKASTESMALFTRRFDDDILVVHVYVDDFIFGSTNPRYATLFSGLMKSRFEMSMMGEMTFFLGLQVNQSPSAIFINQSNYVNEILKKYGLNTYDIIGTPMDIKDKIDLDQIGTPVDVTKYRSMIGALMYLTSSRPDIVHATCVYARYQAQPIEKHLKEVKRIFCYLWRTVNIGLWYTKDSSFELTEFSDADYARCKDTFKRTFGGAQFFGKKLVSRSSKKQDYTVTDYGYHFDKIPIYCDSKSAIAISCNPVQHSRTKHIAVRYHFIKEHVEKGMIELDDGNPSRANIKQALGRPDIVHATCVCARYLAQPTEKHLKEVKRIFRYLRGTANMGLWYTKDSGFDLTGFSDANYTGCKDTFKSTSGRAQFIGKKLMSCSLKKQDCTSLSTAESEYVCLSAC
nr:uncharacterized mitochondrial protein AtMg00810-like [Tanacetum cinerariifolium]